MEILRNIEFTIADKLEKLGRKILFKTLMIDLDVSHKPIGEIGTKRFIEEDYNPYFDRLMHLSPDKRREFIDEKLSHIPESRHQYARNVIQRGIRDFISREKEMRD